MRIVIDARLWSESGIGRYIRNLISQLQKADNSNEYFILHLKKDYDGVTYHDNFKKVLADFKWYGFAEQIKLPKLLYDLNPDLVHFPHFNVPVLYKGKYVVTIHDLIHQHFVTRETTTKNPLLFQLKKYGYRKAFSTALKKSCRIISPSEFVKKQLMDEWGVEGKKVIVTTESVDERIIKIAGNITNKDAQKVLNKFSIKKPFIFYVGNAQPHKNIFKLVRAFILLKKNYPNLSLVLSGPEHYFWRRIREGVGELEKEDVIFTGYVSEEELVALYKNAEAFVLPSLEEGFGIPILEAMACETPVVGSPAGSLPEVGGDAALYFDPKDERDMAFKLLMVLKDPKLRSKLIREGAAQYRKFSWEKMAEQTIEVYQQCA